MASLLSFLRSTPTSSSSSSLKPPTLSTVCQIGARFCPYDWSPLVDPVSCWPCHDIISKKAAEILYGKMDAGSCSIQNKSCIVCHAVVKAYLTESETEKIFYQYTSQRSLGPLEELNKLTDQYLSTKGTVTLPTKLVTSLSKSTVTPTKSRVRSETDIKNETERKEILAYPGKSALFKYKKGNWIDSREIEFLSTVDSLIHGFTLKSLTNSSLVLSIECQRNNEQFSKYLSSFDIKLKQQEYQDGRLSFSSIDEIRTLFTIICRNNRIPPDYLAPLKTIIMKGTP